MQEQVRKIFETLSNNTGYDYSMEDYIFHESLLPIELPSDEEMEKQSKYWNETTNPHMWTFKLAWKAGAKWMKEQILNQNK